MLDKELSLGLDALIRSIGVNRATLSALFLGAGASISSGVPSAAMCIWEWKRSIFLTNNPGLEAQFAELSLPSIQLRIQQWLDQQRTYPRAGSPEEYGVYIQKCFPIAEDRRAFFQEKVRLATPHVGYRLLSELAVAELVESVWTTNFDGLAAKAASAGRVMPIEVGIDCQHRLLRKVNRRELLCVSLHGDYRYDALKNTPTEIQQQEQTLATGLTELVKNTPLIVLGYSGRDASIMKALQEGYGIAGQGTLYWCGFSDGPIPEPVRRLITTARINGRNAHFVPGAAFDDVILRVALHCLQGEQAETARKTAASQEETPIEVRADFQLPDLPATGIIKANAFEFLPPGEIYEFDLDTWPEEGVWKYFDQCTSGRELIAAPFKRKGYAFGTIDEIRRAFSPNIKTDVSRVPINEKDLRYEDGVIASLIRRAVVRALAAKAQVCSDGRGVLWEKSVKETRTEAGVKYLVKKAVLVYVRRIARQLYVALKPTVRVERPDETPVPEDVERSVKMAVLGWQHNSEFNQEIDEWRKKLFMTEPSIFEFPANCGSPFRFQVKRAPIFAEVAGPASRRPITIPENFQRSVKHRGIELLEPRLLFSKLAGVGTIVDTHPVRGIAQNQPFDFPLSSRGMTGPISIGVVCPAAEAKLLAGYLRRLQQTIGPGKSEADYLPPFTGFEKAFGVPIEVPEPGGPLWITCPEIDANSTAEEGAVRVSRHITTCVSALRAAAAPSVTVIFFPERWSKWRSFETEYEKFDLHNFVKAFCVPQGIATQFLEEDTLTNELQCRIRWWLSLALYVKSMRTPWVLASLDPDSAFVGLGISLDRKAPTGNHVVLGCSHLYNAQGEGLQFRLSRIENPIFRRRKPFMSYDDARRVGETIRQLFYEARMRLPRRVVVHKLTPFLTEERKGLQDGLSGVKEIDLLEIHIDDALRYLSSVPGHGGKFTIDRYPVKRGTVVKLDADSALLWVHGVSTALNPKLNYYQGKRRIPAPLVIKRHAGKSELAKIGEEILGLSKMNWNSFDLYAKLPATIESSRQIAKIGSLMQRFGSTSYDYRLFM